MFQCWIFRIFIELVGYCSVLETDNSWIVNRLIIWTNSVLTPSAGVVRAVNCHRAREGLKHGKVHTIEQLRSGWDSRNACFTGPFPKRRQSRSTIWSGGMERLGNGRNYFVSLCWKRSKRLFPPKWTKDVLNTGMRYLACSQWIIKVVHELEHMH